MDWVPILVSALGVLGTVVGAYFARRSAREKNLQESKVASQDYLASELDRLVKRAEKAEADEVEAQKDLREAWRRADKAYDTAVLYRRALIAAGVKLPEVESDD